MPLKHKLRPAPEHIKRMRIGATHRWFARFYGNYDAITGRLGRFSLQVRVSSELRQNRRALANNIRMVVRRLLEGNIPEHVQGETFQSFRDLMLAKWFRVRRLRNYEAGVVYGR